MKRKFKITLSKLEHLTIPKEGIQTNMFFILLACVLLYIKTVQSVTVKNPKEKITVKKTKGAITVNMQLP